LRVSYRITFVLDGSHRGTKTNEKKLRIIRHALTAIDVVHLRAHPKTPDFRVSGVRMQKDSPGQRNWQDIPSCLKVKAADQDDVACWLAAQAIVRQGIRAKPELKDVGKPIGQSHRVTVVVDGFHGAHDQVASHKKLSLLLNALTAIDILTLLQCPDTPDLYKSGIRYEEEPLGQEDWQDTGTCLKLGFGDCEDLACMRAAELNVRHGIAAKPTFIWKRRPNGGYLYHIQVMYPDGRVEDPSRALGMH